MITPLVLGILAGAGAWLAIHNLTPHRPPLTVTLGELATPSHPAQALPRSQRWAATVALRLFAIAGGDSASRAADLEVIERSVEAHAIDKLRTAVFLAALAPATWLLAVAGGVYWSPGVVVAITVALAVAGWVLSDVQVRTRAAKRRQEFASTLVTYLQLVTILLAGGAGVNQALREAADYGQGWSFRVLKAALNDARTRSVSPWVSFGATADRLGLTPLAELAAAMQLAGQSGAHVRQSLLAKADSLRTHELADIEAEAASATERMGGPIAAMVGGFVVLVGYPAFAAILAL